jgi:hypothetical protein
MSDKPAPTGSNAMRAVIAIRRKHSTRAVIPASLHYFAYSQIAFRYQDAGLDNPMYGADHGEERSPGNLQKPGVNQPYRAPVVVS